MAAFLDARNALRFELLRDKQGIIALLLGLRLLHRLAIGPEALQCVMQLAGRAAGNTSAGGQRIGWWAEADLEHLDVDGGFLGREERAQV
jgi:hypothetical protein